MSKCKWKIDEDGIYHAECDNDFIFDSGTIEENSFKYCPYCGKEIKESDV